MEFDLILFSHLATAPKSKRKISESTPDKRDKKSKPKKRTTKDTTPEIEPPRSTTPPIQGASTSITDVFADHLIQQARKVIEPPLSVKKAERNGPNDGFDIPTISEIAKKAVGAVVCRKEITELAELQKKIDQAKRQLRHMTDESEDEDFINLGADKIDFDAELSNNGKEQESSDGHGEKAQISSDVENLKSHQKITFDEKSDDRDSPSKRRPVHHRLGIRSGNELEKGEKNENVHLRLGLKSASETEKGDSTENSERNKNIISLSAHRRMEQAIYVPAHRRTSDQKNEHDRVRDRSPNRSSDSRRLPRVESRVGRDLGRDRHSRDANEPRDLREKVRQRERDNELRGSRSKRDTSRDRSRNDEKSNNNRIGSKVIVAPPKPEYEEDEKIEVPVNSVVKVKPRPLIPRSKQASKNLLLRAVAEAQKSTALVKPATREFKAIDRNTKELYTKSFRNKLQKDNIVVEIAADGLAEIDLNENEDAIEQEPEEEEYIPTPVSIDEDPFIYIPQAIHNHG